MRAELLTGAYRAGVRPILFRSHGGDPELIHEEMISLLARIANTPLSSLARLLVGKPRQGVEIAGVKFPGRVGVAAGLDKEGTAAWIWASLGFGFAELGTVTAQAQPGNPRPRVFRLRRSQGLINRMGFNNPGADELAHRLAAWGVKRGDNTLGIPLGISIGKTKMVEIDKAIDDYLESLVAVHPYADYIAVNVSSPNTPGLRGLQEKSHIHDLTRALVNKAESLDRYSVPIFVKLAPDLSDGELDDLLEAVVDAGASGLIATNTTLEREHIAATESGMAREEGGLSGMPLTRRARQVVARTMLAGLPVIASGGIMSAADAQAMFDLGASAVQVFSGFIYSGPGLVAAINALKLSEET